MVVTHGTPPAASGRWAVSIGNFDGVHLGHRALLERVNAKARELGIGSCILTFEPHPREFFAPDAAPPRLTRLRDKLELIAGAGVGRVHVARFDARLAALTAQQFIDEVLLRGLGARWLAVGRDFRFGKGRSGDYAALEAAGAERGFGLEALPDVLLDGERVSSSAVRVALQAGDLARADRLLGRRYWIGGRVVRGAGLGRELGCATANIPLPHRPALSGIYVVHVAGLGPGVASLGRRPTVNPVAQPLLEVHLLDFDADLYGRRLRVVFLEKIRDEEKYPDLNQLRKAIAGDVRRAQDYFRTHGRLQEHP